MRKKPEIKNYDDRWAEHCHSKLNSKNIAHMNGIVILFHPVCTHTHSIPREHTLFALFYTCNLKWELAERVSKTLADKKTTATNWNARHYIKRVWIYNCNVLLKFADCKRKDQQHSREREREREWTEGVKKGDRKRRANNVKNQTGQHTHVCAEKDGRNAHS